MRATEFITEDDATTSGNIAMVVAPLGNIQRRAPLETSFDKYKKTRKKRVSKNERKS
jgi:hypothetical protein